MSLRFRFLFRYRVQGLCPPPPSLVVDFRYKYRVLGLHPTSLVVDFPGRSSWVLGLHSMPLVVDFPRRYWVLGLHPMPDGLTFLTLEKVEGSQPTSLVVVMFRGEGGGRGGDCIRRIFKKCWPSQFIFIKKWLFA